MSRRPRPRRQALGLLSLLLVLAACSGERQDAADTLAAVRQRGELTWGADLQGGEPFLWEDPDRPGELLGFEVEIMKAVARRLGVRQRMVQCDWSNLLPSLERRDFDLVFNGLEATTERRDRILLSRPYFVYAETLAVRRGSSVRSLEDLRGKRVGTLNQTYALDLLRAAPVEVVLYEGNEEPYRDLELGRLEAVLLDNVIADRYGCNRQGITCLPDEVARGVYVAGFRKGDAALAAAVDEALAAMQREGELEQILRKAGLWDERQSAPPPQEAAAPASSEASSGKSFGARQWRQFAAAALVTLLLSVAAFGLAVPLGMALATARLYGGPLLRALARGYVELFRGTPVLLQLFVLYYGLASYINLGPMQAAILGLGLNYAAYEAEVLRGALAAVPRGQSEAARALGLAPWQVLRHVLWPQALRISLPAMTNDFVSLLKDSSLVSVLAVAELLQSSRLYVSRTFQAYPGYNSMALVYLALTLLFILVVRFIEKRWQGGS